LRAARLKIHNFRSLGDVDVELHPYSMLVGPNNAGKSNMLDAIRAFYEKDIAFDFERDFPKFRVADDESWIEIVYRPDPEELNDLKQEYKLNENTFCVRKYLKSKELDDDGKPLSGIYAYVGGKLSKSRFYGAKNVQQGKLGEIIYIPAVSKLDEHTKLTGPSALRELINMVMKEVVASSKPYGNLKSAFQTFAESIHNEVTPAGHSLAGIEQDVSAEITSWGAKLQLSINPISPDEVVKNLIDVRIFDSALQSALELSAFGDGFQRQLIFTLLRLSALYQTAPEKERTRKEFSPKLTWILFEEPEAFLHLPQIEVLDSTLRSYAGKDGNQVMISSHNPQFVSRTMEQLPSIVRVCREGTQTQAGQIRSCDLETFLELNKGHLERIKAAGVQIDDRDFQIEMQAIKYALWLNPLRCNAFFAGKVCLVEGPTESALFEYLVAHNKLHSPDGGIFFLDSFGKWNMDRFINLLGRMRIPHVVIYDRDTTDAKSAIIESSINSSKNEYTKAIDIFDKNLETFIGIPSASEPHRKPQHVMWYLKQEKIPLDRLQALCAKLQALIDA
jgi:putative ATP-dependent endonuclease of OLD family